LTPEEGRPSAGERLGLALFLGVVGFITGVLTVWAVSDLPGVHLGKGVYLSVAAIAGLACFYFGYRSSERTIDALGAVWDVVWKLSLGVIGIVSSLLR